MFTILTTAFSFLAANFGWFGGLPQTEIFFWTEVIIAAVIIVAMTIFVVAAGGGIGGLGVGLIILLFEAINVLIVLLAAWVCSMLWPVDLFLAYQLMAIGAAIGGFFKAKNNKNQ